MVDFKKRLSSKEPIKNIDPIVLYDTLDRKSETGPLRPAQRYVLSEWYKNRYKESSLIVKLHTGEGKTLIGLLMLLSKLNNGEGPCLYLCPNKYLVHQVSNEANKFGIPICLIEDGTAIPNDFLDGKKILITTVKRLFNGKSKFGLDHQSIPVGAILLDDSHACIESIEESFTIRIPRLDNEGEECVLYSRILTLFEDDLCSQGAGNFYEIQNGNHESILQIPYWSWIDKSDTITRILYENLDNNCIDFVWPLLKNRIKDCQCFISGAYIEITPLSIDLGRFGTFYNAKYKILMSATTQNDAFFIKTLEFPESAIRMPLSFASQKWSGEKMIIIPSLIGEELDKGYLRPFFAKSIEGAKYGRAILVPSFAQASIYSELGADVITKEDINVKIGKFRNGNFDVPIVLVNRYDGVDLPDDTCRVLVIDSMPFFVSLRDTYNVRCRKESDIVNIRLAQKIEQGLGRSVRGEKDYCVILIVGADIVRFLMSHLTTKYFSPQTRRQLGIAMEIAKMAQEDISEDTEKINILNDLIKQALFNRDDWKGFYNEQMNLMDEQSFDLIDLYPVLMLEREIGKSINCQDFHKARENVQKILDQYITEETERGWYLQLLARCLYYDDPIQSGKIQSSAFKLNSQLLFPREGIAYKKLETKETKRIEIIKEWMSHQANFDEMHLFISRILEDLSFGNDSDAFENALCEIGKFIGFTSQRPDKEYKKGADVLWNVKKDTYIIFECKNMVKEEREKIKKSEAAQMNTHCIWFCSTYGDSANYLPVMIISTRELAYDADLNSNIVIMRKGKLRQFKDAVRGYLNEFKNYDLNDIPDSAVQSAINAHGLSVDSLLKDYYESPKR